MSNKRKRRYINWTSNENLLCFIICYHRVKMNPANGICTSYKGLASKIYKEPIQLNMNIKTSQLWAKTGKGLYRDISPKKICISPIDT